uniref:Uncharacterized protein n=1 Tax=Pycnococcus provasolii TaxID=41880 RepID=A0A7S2AZ06_9CHLO|mmetsp:Transcript_4170/g.9429  ORF Transcript_4170/g.9429 Transcript_4170/m.9429 type:complete len:199 (+) Transcript_4170:41-637(+)
MISSFSGSSSSLSSVRLSAVRSNSLRGAVPHCCSPLGGTSRKRGVLVQASYESKSDAYARIRAQREKTRKQRERGEFFEKFGGVGSALNGVIGALDFQEDIAEDRDLIKSLRNLGKGEKMSREQYGALRRKVGGTKSGFFGETVESSGRYLESGWLAGTRSFDEDDDDTDNGFKSAPIILGGSATLLAAVGAVLYSLP